MSKIALMGSGSIDPINRTKRVFWRPVTATTVLKVGQPVCYNSDAVVDHKERTADPAHLGLTQDTYAEGEQEFTGRMYIVEEPLTANLHAFAGIVKSLGEKAGADGDMIEIFTPVEDVIVPVFTDENCTLDRTILGIRNASVDATYPGRPIGIAIETKDRSGTSGTIWMKFKSFGYDAINGAGDATANSLVIDDEAAANAVTIKALNLKFTGTGRARGLYYVGDINGAGHANFGMFKFRTYISAAMSTTVHTLCANLHIKDAGTLAATGEQTNAALYLTVETEVTSTAPTLSGGNLAAIMIGYYVDETTAAPLKAYPFFFNTDLAKGQFDGLFSVKNAADIAVTASDGGVSTHKIPVDIAGTTRYVMLSDG